MAARDDVDCRRIRDYGRSVRSYSRAISDRERRDEQISVIALKALDYEFEHSIAFNELTLIRM